MTVCALHAVHLRRRTLSEYLMLIAFPLQQWLHERASVSHYTYIACLNFRFSPCIIIVNHFYYPTDTLNYTKLRG